MKFCASRRRAFSIAILLVSVLVSGRTTLAQSTCTPDWQPTFAPSPGLNHFVRAMTVFDDGAGPALYVGGSFTDADGAPLNYVGKWDGSSWSALGSGTNSSVLAMRVFDDGTGNALYVGGSFSTAGGALVGGIAKWDGSNWSALGNGANTGVSDITVFDDGNGPALHASGGFGGASGPTGSNVAKWDGSNWIPLGSGMNDTVNKLASFDDGGGAQLYAGGDFNTVDGVSATRIAKWDGANWSPLGTGTSGDVEAMGVFNDGGGDALYVGGNFLFAGGVLSPGIAKWDGVSWTAVGGGLDSTFGFPTIRSLVEYDDGNGPALVGGGRFNFAGGAPTEQIAKWDGTNWTPLGDGLVGLTPNVYSMAVYDDGGGAQLFSGGFVAIAGGVAVRNIASWDGSDWSTLGTGLPGNGGDSLDSGNPNLRVLALSVFDGDSGAELFAAGHMHVAGSQVVRNIARWNGSNWDDLGTGVNGDVNCLTVFDDGGGEALYAGGSFTLAGGQTVSNLAKWDGANWAALTGVLNGSVFALTVFDDGGGEALYAGGDFKEIDGLIVNRVAKWDGTNWSALSTGTNVGSSVRALAVFDDGGGDELYVTGTFIKAGPTPALNIAKWNGSSWSALGNGLSQIGHVLEVFDDGSGEALYVGGEFANAGGVPATRIAKWDASGWSAVGGGMGAGTVLSLSAFDDGRGVALYAGGAFLSAGSFTANNIAKWDGSSWTPVGVGTNGEVRALTTYDAGSGASLFVGGEFTRAGAVESNALSEWGCANTTSPALTSDVANISLSAGGQQLLTLDGGAAQAGWFYFMFGSATGTTPGIDFGGGVLLPLNFDVYFALTLNKPGLAAFGNFRGSLDVAGQAQSVLTLPALMDPSLVGVVINHAYLSGSVFGTPEFASNAVAVTLVL